METMVIMKRSIYKDFPVGQNSKNGMLNATQLLTGYNKMDHELLGETKKELSKFTQNKSTTDFINKIMEKESLEKKDVLTIRRGKYGGTWMHPRLFLDFAMWLSPEFKYAVTGWILDGLIQFRNDSGDSFKEVGAILSTNFGLANSYEYQGFARRIYKAILPPKLWGDPDKWQKADEKELKLRNKLHTTIVQFAESGKFVNEFEVLQIAMRVHGLDFKKELK